MSLLTFCQNAQASKVLLAYPPWPPTHIQSWMSSKLVSKHECNPPIHSFMNIPSSWLGGARDDLPAVIPVISYNQVP